MIAFSLAASHNYRRLHGGRKEGTGSAEAARSKTARPPSGNCSCSDRTRRAPPVLVRGVRPAVPSYTSIFDRLRGREILLGNYRPMSVQLIAFARPTRPGTGA